MHIFAGNVFAGSAGQDDGSDSDGDHGASQGRAAGHDPAQETPAASPAPQRTDRAHGKATLPWQWTEVVALIGSLCHWPLATDRTPALIGSLCHWPLATDRTPRVAAVD